MLRMVARTGFQSLQKGVAVNKAAPVVAARSFSAKKESYAEIDARFEKYFNRPEIDSWELRQGLAELHHRDMYPNTTIITAALKACRRINDLALAIRFLEALKHKTRSDKGCYEYFIQEVRPTLTELGIPTPEELGYDKPELWLVSPDDFW